MTARAGVRPGVVEDPEPRRETEHELYAASRGPKPPSPGVPSLATPLLAGQATEVLDASTLAFLTRAVLKEHWKRRQRRKAEEHEERKLALNRRVRDDLPLTSAEHAAWKESACPPSSAGKRRKRKKRRKKKTPKASSSRGRARRRHRQWHFCGAGSTGFAPLRDVFGRLVMLGIMAGMEQKGFFKFVDIPFVLQTQILMVQTIQQTTEFPVAERFRWVDAPVVLVFLAMLRSCRLRQIALMAGSAGYDAPRLCSS